MIEESNGKKFGLPLSHCGLARGVLVYVEKFAVKMLKLLWVYTAIQMIIKILIIIENEHGLFRSSVSVFDFFLPGVYPHPTNTRV